METDSEKAINMATRDSEDRQEDLLNMCGACRSTLERKTAKLLPCLHTVCGTCAIQPCNEGGVSEASTAMQCPVCKEKCNGNDIKENLFIKWTYENRTCMACEEDKSASSFCTVCSEWLCPICTAAHKRVRVTKDHKICPMDEAILEQHANSINKPLSRCSIHDQEILQMFCESCDVLTCRDCQLHDHKDHKYMLASEAFMEQKEFLKSSISKLKSKLQILLEQRIELEALERELSTKKQEIDTQTSETTSEVSTWALNTYKLLSTDLNDLCNPLTSCLDKHMQQVRDLKSRTSHCLQVLEQVLASEDDSLLLYTKSILVQNIDRVLEEMFPKVNASFLLDISFISELDELFGYIDNMGYLEIAGQVFPEPVKTNAFIGASLSSPTSQLDYHSIEKNSINKDLSPSCLLAAPKHQEQDRKRRSPPPLVPIIQLDYTDKAKIEKDALRRIQEPGSPPQKKKKVEDNAFHATPNASKQHRAQYEQKSHSRLHSFPILTEQLNVPPDKHLPRLQTDIRPEVSIHSGRKDSPGQHNEPSRPHCSPLKTSSSPVQDTACRGVNYNPYENGTSNTKQYPQYYSSDHKKQWRHIESLREWLKTAKTPQISPYTKLNYELQDVNHQPHQIPQPRIIPPQMYTNSSRMLVPPLNMSNPHPRPQTQQNVGLLNDSCSRSPQMQPKQNTPCEFPADSQHHHPDAGLRLRANYSWTIQQSAYSHHSTHIQSDLSSKWISHGNEVTRTNIQHMMAKQDHCRQMPQTLSGNVSLARENFPGSETTANYSYYSTSTSKAHGASYPVCTLEAQQTLKVPVQNPTLEQQFNTNLPKETLSASTSSGKVPPHASQLPVQRHISSTSDQSQSRNTDTSQAGSAMQLNTQWSQQTTQQFDAPKNPGTICTIPEIHSLQQFNLKPPPMSPSNWYSHGDTGTRPSS